MEYNNFENRLCKALIKIKNDNPSDYDKALNVLTFIYKDIRQNFIHDGHYFQKEPSLTLKELKGNLMYLTESENGIIDNLIDMCQNTDKRFSKRFFQDIEVPIDMLRNNIYGMTSNYLYVVNIYTMLQAYKQNKDNYENYEAVMDDISLLFIEDSNYYINSLAPIRNIREILDKFVSNKNYKDIKDLRVCFKKFFKTLTKDYEEKEYKRLSEMFKMYSDFYNHLNNENRNTRKISKELEKEISDDISLLVHPDLLPGIYPFYSRILIYNNRYRYFKEKIRVVNPCYRKEVFDTVRNLNIGMFADLNKEKEEDSFEKYMDVLFDSDTNIELYNKMRMLTMASEKYSSGDKDGAFLTLKCLDDELNKAKFGNVVIAYPKDESINKKDKPKTIDQRMEELYRSNDLIREEFEICKERKSLEEFNMQILDEMNSYSVNKFAVFQPKESPEAPVVKKKSIFSGFNQKR